MFKKKIALFILFGLIVKVILASYVPLFGDEAYYYIWSLHPQLSYFDHPPMVSWFISASNYLLPQKSLFALRLFFVIASTLTAIIWVVILKIQKISDNFIFVFLVLMLLNPLLGAGSVLATPDTPLVLFWSLSFLSFINIERIKNLFWYIALGAFLGLGFCSKYHIVLFVFSGLIYLLFNKKIFTLRPLGVLLTICTGAVFSLPVLIWNSNNNWVSFLFQLQHGFGESNFEWAWPASYLIAQVLIINPYLFFTLFKKTENNLNQIFSFSQLIFFFTSSFKNVVEGNWPITSHLHTLTHFSKSSGSKFFKYSLFYWLVFYSALILFLALPASEKVRNNLVNSGQLDELLPLVNGYSPLYGPSYQVSSLLTWKTQKSVPKLIGLNRHDFYDTLQESTPVTTKFFVLKYNNTEWPARYIAYKKISLQNFDKLNLQLYLLTYE